MIFKIKYLGVLALVLLVCIISVCGINFEKGYVFANGSAVLKPQIILDAGHGGLTNTID